MDADDLVGSVGHLGEAGDRLPDVLAAPRTQRQPAFGRGRTTPAPAGRCDLQERKGSRPEDGAEYGPRPGLSSSPKRKPRSCDSEPDEPRRDDGSDEEIDA